MKKYLSLITVLVLCLVTFVFAEELSIYKSPTYNFTIGYPEKWEVKQSGDNISFISPLLDYRSRKEIQSIKIVVEDVTGKNLNLEEYAKSADDGWLNSDSKLKIEDFQKTNVSGIEAFCTIAANDKFNFKQYKLIKDNTAYIITCASVPEFFKVFSYTINDVLKSFKI